MDEGCGFILKTFPEKYPYTNRHGFQFTELKVNTIIKSMKEFLRKKRIDADNHNLDIAEVLLRVMSNFDPSKNVPIEIFAKLSLLKQVYRRNKLKMVVIIRDGEKVLVPVTEIPLREDLQLPPEHLPNANDELYDLVSVVRKSLGHKYEKLVKLQMEDVTETDAAKIMGVSRSNISRMSLRIRQEIERYLDEQYN